MTSRQAEGDLSAVLAQIAAVQDRRPGERVMIGIAGPPGAGKSTLAEAVVAALGSRAALVAMDGFHFDNRVLAARGLSARKGAPESFDALGLLRALTRLRAAAEEVALPIFDRERDLAIAGAAVAPVSAEIVVVEGNYLLLRHPPWRAMSALFDASIFLAPSMAELERRLLARWRRHGRADAEAAAWVRDNDLVNARLVLDQSALATLRLGADAEDEK